jgi:hypothetical protein
VVGPRLGRYDPEGRLVDLPGHSSTLQARALLLCPHPQALHQRPSSQTPLSHYYPNLNPCLLRRYAQALGTFVLWVGWYGFNPGSTLAITGGLGAVASKCAVTTTLAAAAGALGCLAIYKYWGSIFSLGQTLNGVLVGLVSITAGCSVVEPYAAVIIGLIGAAVYAAVSEFIKRVLKIDDVVDAFAVHCGGGMWGLVAASLFATKVRPPCSGTTLSSVRFARTHELTGRLTHPARPRRPRTLCDRCGTLAGEPPGCLRGRRRHALRRLLRAHWPGPPGALLPALAAGCCPL